MVMCGLSQASTSSLCAFDRPGLKGPPVPKPCNLHPYCVAQVSYYLASVTSYSCWWLLGTWSNPPDQSCVGTDVTPTSHNKVGGRHPSVTNVWVDRPIKSPPPDLHGICHSGHTIGGFRTSKSGPSHQISQACVSGQDPFHSIQTGGFYVRNKVKVWMLCNTVKGDLI